MSLFISSCADDPPPGTLGQEVTRALCVDLAAEQGESRGSWKPLCRGEGTVPADAPPALQVMVASRVHLAAAIDESVPEAELQELADAVGELGTPPFADDTDPRAHAGIVAAWLDALAADDATVDALADVHRRAGYRHRDLDLGLVRGLIAHPELPGFTETVIESSLRGSLREPVLELTRALALTLAAGDDDGTAAGDLLLAEANAFSTEGGRAVLLRDRRGLALINDLGAGSVPPPFADTDDDGLADVDASDQFVDANGAPIDLPAPFWVPGEGVMARDRLGRALRPNGAPWYVYSDGSRSMLGALLGEVSNLHASDPPALIQLAHAGAAWLGPPTAQTRTYDSYDYDYPGIDTSSAPILDVVAGAGELLTRQAGRDLITVARDLVRDHESDLAPVMHSGFAIADAAGADAGLETGSTLWDELIERLVDIVGEPDMLGSMMRALVAEESLPLGPTMAGFMTHTDRVTYDPNDVNGPPIGLPLDQPVDRAAPDGPANESLFQRSLALYDGISGLRVCNRDGAKLNLMVQSGPTTVPLEWPLFGSAAACELIDIPDLGEAYAQAILGTFELPLSDGVLDAYVAIASTLGISIDRALELSFGIDGLTRFPTPQALNRLLFWGLANDTGTESCVPDANGGNCNNVAAGQLFAPVVDRHGNSLIERYHGTAFAWEDSYPALRPLLTVMQDPQYVRDAQDVHRLEALVGILHRHWPSPDSTLPCAPPTCAQSNARSFEPALAVGLGDEALLTRLRALQLTVESLEPRTGVDGFSALLALVDELVDPAHNPGFTNRRGEATTAANDGTGTIAMTPLYAMLGGFRSADAAWTADPDGRGEFLRVRALAIGQLLGTAEDAGNFQVVNRRGRRLLLQLLLHARQQLIVHQDAGDLDDWARGLDERLAESLNDPLVLAVLRLADALNDDAPARLETAGLLGHLLGPDHIGAVIENLTNGLASTADDGAGQTVRRGLSKAIAPNTDAVLAGTAGSLDVASGALYRGLSLLGESPGLTSTPVLRRIMQRAAGSPLPRSPMDTVIDLTIRVHRVNPGAVAPLDAADYRAILAATAAFLTSDGYGFAHLHDALGRLGRL